jgi:hypothetical protein
MRPNWIPLACLVATAALLLPQRGAEAGTVLAMNLEQMTDRADVIFVGRVAGQRADWSADRTRIYTYVTFEVDRYLKGGGAQSRQTTVRLLGGQLGPYMVRVPGMPQFTEGEDVLLFCSGAGARIPTVLGMSLGKFTIATNGAGERIVRRDISTLMLANYRTDSRQPGDPVNRYLLADIEGRIHDYLR